MDFLQLLLLCYVDQHFWSKVCIFLYVNCTKRRKLWEWSAFVAIVADSLAMGIFFSRQTTQ